MASRMQPMKPKQRRDRLLRILRTTPDTTPVELARIIGAAQETVRNDLVYLEKQGVLERGRGRLSLLQTDEAFNVIRQSGALSKSERLDEILKLLAQRGSIHPKQLASMFSVSEGTVRNDLIALEKEGSIRREYGQVMLRATGGEIPKTEYRDSVRFICDRALSLIESGDQIFLDSSDCSAYIASKLPVSNKARIVTNSVKVAGILTGRGYTEDIFVLPGLLQPDSSTIDVQLRESVTRRIHITKAFMYVSAASKDGGFYVGGIPQLNLCTLITGITDNCYIFLESANVGKRDHYAFPLADHLSKVSEVIVDDVHQFDPESFFSPGLPVAICGDNVVLKSPFNKQYIIGFSILDGSHEYSQIVRKSIEDAVKKYANIELVITDNKMDPNVTLANVETFIQNDVDLVIEYSQSYQLGPLIAEKLSHSSIPLLAVDIPIPGAVYFGANNYRAGRLAGEAAAQEVVRKWGGDISALIVVTESAAGPSIGSRIAGMLEAFKDVVSFDQESLHTVDVQNDVEDASAKLSDTLKGFSQSDRIAVFSFNAVATAGIVDSLRFCHMDKNSIVVSHNYMQSTARELERQDTPLLGAVAFSPESYGSKIMQIALRMLNKEPVERLYFTSHRWIGRDRDK